MFNRRRSLGLLILAMGVACSEAPPPAAPCARESRAERCQEYLSSFLPSGRALDFQKVCVGGTASMSVELRNGGNATVTVTDLSVAPALFTLATAPSLPFEIPAGDVATLTVAFAPTKAGSFSGTLDVSWNVDGVRGPTRAITLVGSGFNGESRHFEVSCVCERQGGATCGMPDTTSSSTIDRPCQFLSYDNVPNGTALGRTVRVENNGCLPLEIQPVWVANSTTDVSFFAFSTATGPITLQGGEARDLAIGFAPRGDQAVTPDVRLKFVSDDTALREGQSVAGTWELALRASSVMP